jgi:PAS domain S-box-containing protein
MSDKSKLKQKKSSMSGEVFYQLVEFFPDIIHSVDEDGNIVFTNKFATELLGYKKEELLNMNIRDIYLWSRHKEVMAGFKKLKKKGRLIGVESVLVDKKGKEIPVEIRSLSLYDKNGRFEKTFSIIRDVSLQKEMEHHLIHTSKMAAIGEVSSCIVHDIRDPLAIISLYNERLLKLLKEGEFNAEDAEEINRAISTGVKKIKILCEHLRNFSSDDEGFEECSLKEIVRDALFMLSVRISDANIKTMNNINRIDEEMEIIGNKNSLEQVFINIVGNACDVLKKDPSKSGENKIILDVDKKPDYYKVAIANNGPMIDKTLFTKIFNSFFTTKPKSEGAGLGLSICSSIIKKHRGEIEVKNTDFGVVFTFTISRKSSIK